MTYSDLIQPNLTNHSGARFAYSTAAGLIKDQNLKVCDVKGDHGPEEGEVAVAADL